MGRFEELESDSDDDDQGVDLDYMHKSDELYFTGGDIGPHRRHNRRSGYEDYSEDSDLDDDFDEEEDEHLALREKEELLVARALERIRRAQALGKPNVKLTTAESDALERKMAKDRAKGRKPIVPTKKIAGSPRNSSRTDLVPATNNRKTSKSSLRPSPSTNPQEEYFVPSSRPGSRPGSSQNLKAQPLTRNLKRFVSDPEPPNLPYSRSPPTRRPLPDDPNWQPRPRSSSSANPPYPVSPQEYSNYPTPSIPTQYTSSRRNVSGPAELGYPELPSGSRQFPVHMPSVRGYASSSDPSLPRRRDVSGGGPGYTGRSRGGGSGGNFDSEDDDDDDEDLDQGVQVDVQPSGSAQGYEISVARNTGGQRGGNASGAGGQKARRGARR